MADGDAVEDIAAKAFERLIAPGPVGVAVSGGGDSMALLALVRRWAPERELVAATVDHGLRPEASDEAAMVAQHCAGQGIPHKTLEISALPETGNLSANLRAARYAALTAWARGHAITQILLGHTMDDQAETVLMRLARRSGADGLSGMLERRADSGITWVRPLLSLRRGELRRWLSAEGLPWVDDPTNDDKRYDRIKARRALEALEPLGITVEGLAQTAEILQRQVRVLDAACDALRAAAERPSEVGTVALDRATLRSAADDTMLRVLGQALTDVGGAYYQPRARSLLRLMVDVRGTGTFRCTLHGCLIETAEDGRVILVRSEPAASRTS